MMNAYRPALFAATCLLTLPSTAFAADTYVIDSSHTSVIFGVSHMGFSYTYGRFNEVAGGYVLDAENPAASQFQLTINAASIDTNDKKRDEHLRGPDFFNVKQFPTIEFKSTGVTVEEKDGKTYYNIAGDFTMHGVTRQVTLPCQKLGEGPGHGGDFRSGFLCQTSLLRSEYGMTNMIPGIGDEVAITVSFEGIRQGGATPQ